MIVYFNYLGRYEVLLLMIVMKLCIRQTVWSGFIDYLIVCILMGWKICEPVCYSLSLLEEEDKAMLEGKWSDYKFYE